MGGHQMNRKSKKKLKLSLQLSIENKMKRMNKTELSPQLSIPSIVFTAQSKQLPIFSKNLTTKAPAFFLLENKKIHFFLPFFQKKIQSQIGINSTSKQYESEIF